MSDRQTWAEEEAFKIAGFRTCPFGGNCGKCLLCVSRDLAATARALGYRLGQEAMRERGAAIGDSLCHPAGDYIRALPLEEEPDA